MKSAIIKAITDAGKPLSADDIAGEINAVAIARGDEGRISVQATRITARSLIEAGRLKAIEAVGMVTRYALPEMSASAAANAKETKPDKALPGCTSGLEVTPLSLDELLSEARATPIKTSRSKADALMPAVQVLRDRGHGWKDCAQWLRSRGHDVGWQSLSKAHQQWKKASPKAATK